MRISSKLHKRSFTHVITQLRQYIWKARRKSHTCHGKGESLKTAA